MTFQYIETTIQKWILSLGVNEDSSVLIADYISFIALVLLSLLTFYFARRIFLSVIHKATARSKNNWDDILAGQKFFKRLAYLVPSYIIYKFTPHILEPYPNSATFIQAAMTIYMVVVIILAINAFLNALAIIYQDFTIAKTRPIKGYVQVAKILIYILGGIVIISMLFGRNPLGIIGGLGAFSAVLLLVFKDPIMGFVGGIQLSANNMLVPGDWITMPKYNADGTVIDVALTTVKVQNWDKTISSIPTYSLISDSFRNWRGMEESGGRRIKRSINIDMKSIRFCTPEMLERFEKIDYVRDYIPEKEKEIQKYNEEQKIDESIPVNGRRQTNIGVFRAYLRVFLHNHPSINEGMTFLIRQLEPNIHGLPIEIYVFSKIQEWGAYEDLQSDIFDHILAVIPEFDLRVYQTPSGDDLKNMLVGEKFPKEL